jgi:hypothetical protein
MMHFVIVAILGLIGAAFCLTVLGISVAYRLTHPKKRHR